MFKLHNNETPLLIGNYQLVRDRYNYNKRHSAKDNYLIPLRHRFMYLGPKIWNSIPITIKNKTFIQFQKLYYDYLFNTHNDIGLGNWLKTKYCVYVLDRFSIRQLTNAIVIIFSLTALKLTFCFYLYLNFNVQSRFMYTEACWTSVSFFIYLFDCWLCVTAMGWSGVGTVSCCQGLARLACVGTVFPNTIWNGLSMVKVFPKIIYVKTVDSRITVFTMSRICCVV